MDVDVRFDTALFRKWVAVHAVKEYPYVRQKKSGV
jgi:hypothetical protein